MLRLAGPSPDRLTRRDLLHVGGLGAFGLGLADALRLKAAAPAPPRGGRAKACILLFPYGSPPQHETFDPKPDAPDEVRGEIGSIPSVLPGVRVGEHLPLVASVLDRVTVVRSVTHRYPEHGVAYAVSGIPAYTPALETRPRDPRHWPFIGSVVDYLDARRTGVDAPAVPRNVGLPWLLNSRTDLDVSAGPYAAFLGQGYDPVWADFDGAGTRPGPRFTGGDRKDARDPFAACDPAGAFRLATAGHLPDGLTAGRVGERRSLLDQFDRARAAADRAPDAHDRYRAMAYSLVTTRAVRDALDVTREPAAVRERYGMHLFGQSCLAARRLVEAGTRFVSVFWDGYGEFAGCAWDTHAGHYPRLKTYLLPGFDRAYSALLLDLEQRGLLDETLVVWMSEHGRTPRIDPAPAGCGRHHWSKAYSVSLAGGGVARGRVVGKTDKIGGEVAETPVSPKDLLATTLHLLGIDPSTHVHDTQGRPFPVAGDGEVRPEVLS